MRCPRTALYSPEGGFSHNPHSPEGWARDNKAPGDPGGELRVLCVSARESLCLHPPTARIAAINPSQRDLSTCQLFSKL